MRLKTLPPEILERVRDFLDPVERYHYYSLLDEPLAMKAELEQINVLDAIKRGSTVVVSEFLKEASKIGWVLPIEGMWAAATERPDTEMLVFLSNNIRHSRQWEFGFCQSLATLNWILKKRAHSDDDAVGACDIAKFAGKENTLMMEAVLEKFSNLEEEDIDELVMEAERHDNTAMMEFLQSKQGGRADRWLLTICAMREGKINKVRELLDRYPELMGSPIFRKALRYCPRDVVEQFWHHHKDNLDPIDVCWAQFCKHADTAEWILENAPEEPIILASFVDAANAHIKGLQVLLNGRRCNMSSAYLLECCYRLREPGVIRWAYTLSLSNGFDLSEVLEHLILNNPADFASIKLLHSAGFRPKDSILARLRERLAKGWVKGDYIIVTKFLVEHYGFHLTGTDWSQINNMTFGGSLHQIRWFIEHFDLKIPHGEAAQLLAIWGMQALPLVEGRLIPGLRPLSYKHTATYTLSGLRALEELRKLING